MFSFLIIVAERDTVLRALICRTLERDGFDTCAAGSGAELDRYISKSDHNVALIVLDILLPDETELSIGERLRATIPVLVLTAGTDTLDRLAVLEEGAHDTLDKPFSPDDLLACIRAMLDWPAQRSPS